MKDPILDLDNIAAEVEEAIDEDRLSVKESETAVEEKLEEDIETAQTEIDEGEDGEEEAELEEEAESLGEVEATLEAYKKSEVGNAARALAIRSLSRTMKKKGRGVFAVSIEDNNNDTDELIDIAKDERKKTLDELNTKKENKKAKKVETWKAIGRAAIKIRDLIKAKEKDEKGKVHLAWSAVSDENRKYFELLTDEGGAEVQDVIKTATLAEATLKQFHKFMTAELSYCASNCTGDDAHLQYAAFIAEWADGRDTLFKDNLLGGFNMEVVSDVAELEQGAIVKGTKFEVGTLTVSSEIDGVDDEVEGDSREDKKYGGFVHGSLAAVAAAVSRALEFYSNVETSEINLLSPRLALRLLRTVVALGITLKDVGESNESADYIIETDDGNGAVVVEDEETEEKTETPGAVPADGADVPDNF